MIDTSAIEIVIDLGAVRHNIEVLRAAVTPAELMVVVKNDAYGHGLMPVVRAAIDAGVTWIGALDVPTALEIRRAGTSQDIRLFAWLLSPNEDYAAAVASSIDLGVSTTAQLDAIAATPDPAGPARVHLKIDTGLHRNGATISDWPGLVSRALELQQSGLITIVATWTHIAEASDEEDTLAISRFNTANTVAEGLGINAPLRHLAASAAGFARPDARFSLVRFGAFVYGLPPGEGPSASSMGLRQTMSLRARVSRVVENADGSRRASLGIGYGDGLSTRAPGNAVLAIGGIQRKITGPLELDRLWIDLEADDKVQLGDVATLWGPGDEGEPTLQEWGDATGTMAEELAVRLSPQIVRRYS